MINHIPDDEPAQRAGNAADRVASFRAGADVLEWLAIVAKQLRNIRSDLLESIDATITAVDAPPLVRQLADAMVASGNIITLPRDLTRLRDMLTYAAGLAE